MKKYTTVKTVMSPPKIKWATKLVLVLFILSLFQGWFLLHPTELDSASLTSASVTMNNGRLSYRAGVGDTFPSGTITIDIDSTGNADNDTDPLFPGDTICFANSALSGCKNNRTYTVGTIVDTNTFTITDGLDGALENTDFVIATQSATLTIAFTTTSVIPSNGDILITIPAIQTSGKTCDGFPDTAALASNGFDLKSVAAGDISTTGCTDANWNTTETITCATGSNDHTIRIDRQTAECAASSAITATIGSTNIPIIPAPESSHTQFTADNYSITIQTRDGSDNVLDTVDTIAAPIEGVFVSATVPETLTFTIASVGIGSTHCNADSFSTDVTTTAYSVPFGTLTTSIGVETFSEAEQQLTVSTNADSGYKVYAEEDDELGKDGSATTYIPDTPCDTSCDHTTKADWLNETINGFGYSLVNSSGTPAKFQYSDGTWNAKHFPNEAQGATQFNATDAELMTASTVASSESVYVCYRLSVDGAQEAGYYYNKITYIATPIF